MNLQEAADLHAAVPNMLAFAFRQRTVEAMRKRVPGSPPWDAVTLCGLPVIIVPPDAPEGVIISPEVLKSPREPNVTTVMTMVNTPEFAQAVIRVIQDYHLRKTGKRRLW